MECSCFYLIVVILRPRFESEKYHFKVRVRVNAILGNAAYTLHTQWASGIRGVCVCAHRLITGGRGAALLPAGWLPQRCPHCSRTAAVDTEPEERLAAPRRKIAPAPPHAKISLPPQWERERAAANAERQRLMPPPAPSHGPWRRAHAHSNHWELSFENLKCICRFDFSF